MGNVLIGVCCSWLLACGLLVVVRRLLVVVYCLLFGDCRVV